MTATAADVAPVDSAPLEVFDDIVFGGGKGGKSLAMALGPAGYKVAMIERGQIGGTCINVACIPTKTMVASAKVLDDARRAPADFGVSVGPVADSLAGVEARRNRVVGAMVKTHEHLFATTPGMELVIGEGRFTGPKEIAVTTPDGRVRRLTAERIYLNTGSTIDIPPIPGLDTVPYLTSTTVQHVPELPDHLLIVGAGYIAVEFAQIFRRLGSRVTMLDRGARFLPREDEDIASEIRGLLSADGIEVLSDAAVASVGPGGSGIDVRVTRAGAEEVVTGSHLLVATGRTPATAGLGLDAAGVEIGPRGGITVDEKLQTNVGGIWALGDCNGGPMFTHASWDDFRIVRDNVLHDAGRTTTGRLMPYTLFIDPELGRVGRTEDQARAEGRDIVVARLPAAKIPRAATSGEQRGLLKAVVDAGTGEILGCSLLCHNAGEIVSVVQTAMIGGLTAKQVADVVYTHPTMAESLNLLFAGV